MVAPAVMFLNVPRGVRPSSTALRTRSAHVMFVRAVRMKECNQFFHERRRCSIEPLIAP